MEHLLAFKTVYDYDLGALDINVPITNVPITLSSGAELWAGIAKLDPGSTFCIFERLVGERLGFDIESGHLQWIGTATGRFLTYGHEVILEVLGITMTATVYFAADEHFALNVLGRVGFVNRVCLGLIDHDGRLYLSSYDDLA